MLSEQNFSLEHIEDVRGSRKVDKTILERSIYALGLLEALARVGLPFIFKGGTSLLLLLDSPMRLKRYNKLSKIKRLAPDGYAYAVEAMELLKKFEEK